MSKNTRTKAPTAMPIHDDDRKFKNPLEMVRKYFSPIIFVSKIFTTLTKTVVAAAAFR